MLQVTTVAQAIQAAEHGVDVIIAQGTEAGGYGGTISTMALVPQVVDAVSPVPVVAAGGIYDGRGIAAALMLGAVGVNMGTRFLASQESPIDDDWKQAIIEARSEDAVKAEVINDIIPVPGTVGYGTVGRTLRTPFLDEWGMKRDEARRNGARLWAEIGERLRRGQRRETLVWAGQTAGGVREILTVAEIMRQLVDQTETALARAPGLH
jgi:enoyl-[acyl-carrier protein] reductase II